MHGHRRPSRGWILWIPFLSLVVPGAVWGDSPSRPSETRIGVAVTAEVPHARESLDEIRRMAPDRLPRDRGPRVIPFRRTPRPTVPSASEIPVPSSLAPEPDAFPPLPNPRSSTVSASFPGLENLPLSGNRDVIPPDTMGAAGPSHLVSILNSEFGIFSKTGTVLSQISLQSFWASLGTDPGEPADFPFDPKILYDQHSGRFVAVTLDCTVAPHSWVLVAVSASSDPTGTWYKWAIDADLDNLTVQSNNSADYPGLGVDEFNIYITSNMFDAADAAQHSKVWVLPKAQLLTNPPQPVISWFEFIDPPFSGFSMQPAHSFGSAAAQYFLFEGSGSSLRLARIDNVAGTPVWQLPVPVSVTPYTPTNNLTGAPQLGDPGRIDTADTRVLNAVYRNGSVWGTHHVGDASGKTEVAWYRIVPSPTAATAIAQGRINHPARWYYYPSIAVNQDNVAAIGFSGSSTAEYASAFYTLVWPTTGADPVALLKAGLAPYNKTLSRSSIRWGDFSATSVDPVDHTSFWTLQEYAMPKDGATSMWGTWWGKIIPGQPSPPPPPPPPPPSGGGGGCAAVGRSDGGPGQHLPIGSLLILVLPAALYLWRRVARSRRPG